MSDDCRALVRDDSRYAVHRECRTVVLERAVALFAEACEHGDLASCVEIGRTYDRDLRYESKARLAYDEACDAGSEEACIEHEDTWKVSGLEEKVEEVALALGINKDILDAGECMTRRPDSSGSRHFALVCRCGCA